METPTPSPPLGWIVRWRMPSSSYAAKLHDTGIVDYSVIWDQIPWSPDLTEAHHSGDGAEAAARDQFHTLSSWEIDRAQPVKDVELLHVTAT